MPTSDMFIVENSSTQTNVTGSGTEYTINFDNAVIDNNNHVSGGVASPGGDPYVIVGTSLTLGGLTALNSRALIKIVTDDGDFILCNEPIYNGTSTSTISVCRQVYLNPNNVSPFTFGISVTVFGGLTDAVDVMANSQFWAHFT